jgi:hypothetical protein
VLDEPILLCYIIEEIANELESLQRGHIFDRSHVTTGDDLFAGRVKRNVENVLSKLSIRSEEIESFFCCGTAVKMN